MAKIPVKVTVFILMAKHIFFFSFFFTDKKSKYLVLKMPFSCSVYKCLPHICIVGPCSVKVFILFPHSKQRK